MLQQYEVTVTSIGDETAEAYTDIPITGKVIAVYLDVGNMTTPIITMVGNTSLAPIVAAWSSGTDAWFYPRIVPVLNTDGTAFVNFGVEPWIFREVIKITMTSAGAIKTCVLTIWVDDERSVK